jgi:hypothetical protein
MKVTEVSYKSFASNREPYWEKWGKSAVRKKAIEVFENPNHVKGYKFTKNEPVPTLRLVMKFYTNWDKSHKEQKFKITVKRTNGFFPTLLNNVKFYLSKITLSPIKNLIKSRNLRKKAIKAFLSK